MTWSGLHVLSLGSLLILNERTSAADVDADVAARSSRCFSEDQLQHRADSFQRYWDKLSVSTRLDTRTCAQMATETHGDINNRSLSPWTYRLNRDMDRFPHEIAFARCLCQGCIINQREELSYNSVHVFVPLMVLRKTRCPQDPKKYLVRKDFIKVPVACTCVVPKSTQRK